MSIEGLLIGALLLGVLGLYVGAPFLQTNHKRRGVSLAVERQSERIALYYERVLRNIHDLDEDFATGKLDPDDYANERELWAQRGITALKALEMLDTEHLIAAENADDSTIDRDLSEMIESAVSAYKVNHMG